MNKEETRMQRKFCGAILAGKDKQPYKKYVSIAESEICKNITDIRMKETIIKAIEKNLMNYKAYPFEMLRRKYNLPMSATDFSKEKKIFCDTLCKVSGIGSDNKGDARGVWTKEDVLNMLYSIADEANDYIVKEDGAFNHQVAGVALKAIDQAVKLCGMCTKEEAPQSAYIELDESADELGA